MIRVFQKIADTKIYISPQTKNIFEIVGSLFIAAIAIMFAIILGV